MARRVAPPDDLHPPDLIAGADYVDAYAADVADPDARSARQWADLVLDGAPPTLMRAVRVAQRAMGFRLVAPGPRTVALRWAVLDERADQVVLGVEGALFTPRVMVTIRDQALLITTVVGHHGALGRRVWAVGSALHRITARVLAEGAEHVPAASTN